MEISTTSGLARRLGSVLEPVIGQVYFSPECHANYVALGFDPSSGDADGVALPDGPAYFASRGSVLGQVPGEVIAAARHLLAHPEVEVAAGGERWSGRARLLDDAEKATCWPDLIAHMPAWDGYTKVTDRDLRVFALERA